MAPTPSTATLCCTLPLLASATTIWLLPSAKTTKASRVPSRDQDPEPSMNRRASK